MLTLEPGGHRAVDKMLCSPLPQNSALWQEEGSPLPPPGVASAVGEKPHLFRPAEVNDLKWDGVGTSGAYKSELRGSW